MVKGEVDTQHAKPFLKWVRGKGKLIPELEKYLPKKIERYFELFVGVGAVVLGKFMPTTITSWSVVLAFAVS